jgi:integrase/recombinase XerC
MSDLVEQWLDHLLRVGGKSPNTVATYRRTLRTVPHPETATREDIEAWWESRAHLAATSRVNELSAVRRFYRWCRIWEHRPAGFDPTERIDPLKVPRGLPRPISREDLLVLLAKLDGEMRRAVCLGAYGGLRVSEAAALRWSDIDQETRRIRVVGKGQKTRLVALPPVLLDSLLPDTGGNVVTGRDDGYSAAGLQRKVNRAIESAGVAATFHQLRHRFATVGLGATGNLLLVSRALGHDSTATTAIYAQVADSDLDLIGDAVTR